MARPSRRGKEEILCACAIVEHWRGSRACRIALGGGRGMWTSLGGFDGDSGSQAFQRRARARRCRVHAACRPSVCRRLEIESLLLSERSALDGAGKRPGDQAAPCEDAHGEKAEDGTDNDEHCPFRQT